MSKLPHNIKVTTQCRSYHTISKIPHKVEVSTQYRSYHTMSKLPHKVQVITQYRRYHKMSKLPHNIEDTTQYRSYHTMSKLPHNVEVTTQCRSYHIISNLVGIFSILVWIRIRYSIQTREKKSPFTPVFPPFSSLFRIFLFLIGHISFPKHRKCLPPRLPE